MLITESQAKSVIEYHKKREYNFAELKELRRGDFHEKNTFEVLTDYVKKYGVKNTYLSFRDSIHTSDINRDNVYGTPTGYYIYPLKSYEIKGQSSYEKPNPSQRWKEFINQFPFGNKRPYVTLFTIENTDGLLFTSSPDEAKCQEYAKRLYQMYKDNPEITKLYNLYLNKDPKISNYHKFNDQIKLNNPVHLLWSFLYETSGILTKKKNTGYNPYGSTVTIPSTNLVNILSRKIGLDGFIDDGCTGFIYDSEPCQGVLFKFKTLATNVIIINSVIERTDTPVPFEKTNYKRPNNISNFIQFLYKKYGKKIVLKDFVNASDNLKKNIPILVSYEGDPASFYVNNKGNLSIENLNFDSLQSNEKAAYINTKLGNIKFMFIKSAVESKNLYIGYVENLGYRFPKVININGETVPLPIDTSMSKHTGLLTACLNSITNSESFSDATMIQTDPIYIMANRIMEGNDNLFFKKNVIVNSNGQEDISHLDPRNLHNSEYLTPYFNILLNKKAFRYVFPYNDINFVARLIMDTMDTTIFINIYGKPDVSGVNKDKLHGTDYQEYYDNTVKYIQNNQL